MSVGAISKMRRGWFLSLAPNLGTTTDKGGSIMPLTDVAIRNAKPREKPYKMGDALGLFLLVQPTGAKLWRLKYRIHGREKKVALGRYPEIGLADARNRTREAREQLAHGLDPGREKQKASCARSWKRTIASRRLPKSIVKSASAMVQRPGHRPPRGGASICSRSCQDRLASCPSPTLSRSTCSKRCGG